MSRLPSLLGRKAVLWGVAAAMALSPLVATGGGTGRTRGPAPSDAAPLPSQAQAPAARTITYTYDASGRLIEADYGDGAIHYTYDAGGNVISAGPQQGVSVFLPLVHAR